MRNGTVVVFSSNLFTHTGEIGVVTGVVQDEDIQLALLYQYGVTPASLNPTYYEVDDGDRIYFLSAGQFEVLRTPIALLDRVRVAPECGCVLCEGGDGIVLDVLPPSDWVNVTVGGRKMWLHDREVEVLDVPLEVGDVVMPNESVTGSSSYFGRCVGGVGLVIQTEPDSALCCVRLGDETEFWFWSSELDYLGSTL